MKEGLLEQRLWRCNCNIDSLILVQGESVKIKTDGGVLRPTLKEKQLLI